MTAPAPLWIAKVLPAGSRSPARGEQVQFPKAMRFPEESSRVARKGIGRVMIRQIDCDQIRVGMYIHGFGGSWFQHPFWTSKFLLTDPDDVEKVRQSAVPYVLIDDERGLAPETEPRPKPAPSAPAQHARRSVPALQVAEPPAPRAQPVSNAEREHRQAKRLVERSKKVIRQLFSSVRLGKAVEVAAVEGIVDGITQSVARSPHALLNVTRLKSKDEYTFLHSIAVCTLMVNLGRHLDLDEATVRDLGLAGLLHDIGKAAVPDAVLNKPGRLTDEEFDLVRAHPLHGARLLADAPDMVEAALDVCRHHHERMDGTGYPFGLDAAQISLAARMGAICDVYDALTSDRIYKEAWTPGEAVAAMWSWQGHFDRALLFAFMQSIGVFPVGMLVRLRSNRLGVVLDLAKRSATPRVCAFYATRERNWLDLEIVEISDSLAADQIIAPERPEHWGFGDWETIGAHLQQGRMPPLAA